MENTDSSGFVLLTDVTPDVILDIRYYTTFNFLGERVDGYDEPVALLTREAAYALRRVSDEAVRMGYRLKIFDAYRPQCAVDHFIRWADAHRDTVMKRYFYPEVDKADLFDLGFVAQRSSHSRGSTVDLTLFDMSTQRDLDVGGTFDYFGNLSWSLFTEDIRPAQTENRALLRSLMQRHGFRPLAEEWWHFTLEDEPYPDIYFTFPVSTSQVRPRKTLSKRLEEDMEFRLRFFDAVSEANSSMKTIISNAVQEAFEVMQREIQAFADREDVLLPKERISDSASKLSTAIMQAVDDILHPEYSKR